MMTIQKNSNLILRNSGGFTLVELMIVMVIVAILATGVVFLFGDPTARVKSAAFNMRGDLNFARSEAVTQNQDILVDFILGAEDGYQICIDATPAGAPDDDCSNETGENFIRETIFSQNVQYYDPAATPPGGPSTAPEGGNLINKGIVDTVGTYKPFIIFEPDGTLDDAFDKDIGAVIYLPEPNDPNKIKGSPYAVTISASTGRIVLMRWRGSWRSK